MSQAFTSLFLVQNYQQLKNSRDWVFPQASPSIRKYGQYKLFDNPNNHMFRIENETDLHTKVVQYIRQFYSGAILIAGFG